MKGGGNIYLVGMMGAGKTTAGKLLARRLKLDFLDSDQEIERLVDFWTQDRFQQIDRDGHLARPEHPRPGNERLKPCAVAARNDAAGSRASPVATSPTTIASAIAWYDTDQPTYAARIRISASVTSNAPR